MIRKRIVSIIASITIALAMSPMVTMAADGVATVEGTSYSLLQEAINNVGGSGQTVILQQNTNEDITVPQGTVVTIDLNGKTLTNSAGHTITNNGSLTIADNSGEGTGTIDNVTHARAAVVNSLGANLTINGGTLTRSAENSGANSYYVLVNTGTMNVNGGTVNAASTKSSGVLNGDPSNDDIAATATISGGIIKNSGISFKNNGKSTVTVTGGTISSESSSALQNWATATISGGTLSAPNASGGAYAITQFSWTNPGNGMDYTSSTTINDGSTINGTVVVQSYPNSKESATPTMKINGGTINGDVNLGNGSNLEINNGAFNGTVEKKNFAKWPNEALVINGAALNGGAYQNLPSSELITADIVIGVTPTGSTTPVYYIGSVQDIDEIIAQLNPGDTVTVEKGSVTIGEETISEGESAVIVEPKDPEVTDPEVTDPEVTDPEVTDPEVTDPEPKPEVTKPETPKPDKNPGNDKSKPQYKPVAENKKVSAVPRTGDSSNIIIWSLALAGAAAVVVTLAVTGKRRSKDTKKHDNK